MTTLSDERLAAMVEWAKRRLLFCAADLSTTVGIERYGPLVRFLEELQSLRSSPSSVGRDEKDSGAYKAKPQEGAEQGWRSMDSAPKDRPIECLHADGEPDEVEWADERACMLGRRAGAHGEGWQDVENRLPVDDPVLWREIGSSIRPQDGPEQGLIEEIISRAEQACRYALKHQNFPADMSKYQWGFSDAAVICEKAIREHVLRHLPPSSPPVGRKGEGTPTSRSTGPSQ